MNSRYLLLLALFFALGCTVSSEPPTGETTPVAPLPKPKTEKTTAELLVGTWKFVKGTKRLHPSVSMTFEYTADGKVTLWATGTLPGLEYQSGAYRVEGDKLLRTMDTEPFERNTTIELLTENKLITAGSSTGERQVHEYERVLKK